MLSSPSIPSKKALWLAAVVLLCPSYVFLFLWIGFLLPADLPYLYLSLSPSSVAVVSFERMHIQTRSSMRIVEEGLAG